MMAAALALWLTAGARAGEPLRGPTDALVEKPYGVLLLGEGGDRDWRAAVSDVVKRAGKRYAVEFAPGLGDAKSMQRGVDALQAQRVKTIVVVPLTVSSHGDAMDQVRYLLGIREKPSEAFLGRARTPPRLRSRVPLVLAKALDDHALFVDLLSARAQALSRNPAQEAVALVGEAPPSKPGDTERLAETEWLQAVSPLAEKVKQKAGFASAQVFALRTTSSKDRRQSEETLRAALKDLRRRHKVIVVPVTMSGNLRLNRVLDGIFAKYDGRAILPDPRVTDWVERSAEPAAKLPDMRLFKEQARTGLAPLGLSKPPALPQPGEKK